MVHYTIPYNVDCNNNIDDMTMLLGFCIHVCNFSRKIVFDLIDSGIFQRYVEGKDKVEKGIDGALGFSTNTR